jgi:hypothetical protein
VPELVSAGVSEVCGFDAVLLGPVAKLVLGFDILSLLRTPRETFPRTRILNNLLAMVVVFRDI